MFILCQAEVVFMAFAHPAVGQEDEHELLPCVAHAAGGDVPRGREPLPVRSAVGRPNLRLQVLQAPDNQNTIAFSTLVLLLLGQTMVAR